tara:strand:+ start:529 stop:1179 length:651 start_codon:yes stop_codon:yes gene_type:complete
MRLFTLIFSLLTIIGNAQFDIEGDWEIQKTNFKFHPFENDTIVLLKPNNIVQEEIITGDSTINLLSLDKKYDSNYIPGFRQKQDTSNFSGGFYASESRDTITKNYSRLLFIQNKDIVTLVFHNDQSSTAKAILKDRSILRYSMSINYRITSKTNQKIILSKIPLDSVGIPNNWIFNDSTAIRDIVSGNIRLLIYNGCGGGEYYYRPKSGSSFEIKF